MCCTRSERLTFIDVRGEASNKDLPGVALHPLSVLTAGRRVQARSQGRVNVAVVKETILKWKKTGATWKEREMEECREREMETEENRDLEESERAAPLSPSPTLNVMEF